MDSIVTVLSKLLSNPQVQPFMENLRKQNEQFIATETSKLLSPDDDDSDSHDGGKDSDDEDLEAATGKEIALSVLSKLEKLFQYTSFQDRFTLFIGLIFTIVHSASFPILAILFGKISNAYIAHMLLEMKNTTLHPHHNGTKVIGATGQLTLTLLTKLTSKVEPGSNASIIPDADKVSGGGYFGNISLYHSEGTESLENFVTYVEEFSRYYWYIGFAVFVSSFIQTVTFECVAETQLYRVKQKYIYQLMRQEIAWFGRRTAGNLVLKIADDCERFREGVGQKFSLVVEYIMIALFGAGIGLITNTKLTLVFLASAPFILTKLLVLWKKIAEKSATAQREYAKAEKISSEVLMGVRTVAALSGEHKEVKRYKAALLKGTKAAERVELLVSIGIGGMYFVIYAFYAVALWYSVNLLAEGAITAGEIYTVFFSLTICAFALGSLLPFINSIAAAYASIGILSEVLDSVPNIDPYSQLGECLPKFTGRIKFNNIWFTYPGREDYPVFKNLKLEIPGSGTVAIVGPCSSGKSTLIKLLLRFYDPQKGQVRFDNYDVKTLNVRWIREQIGHVEQSAVLVGGSTILDNIRRSRKDIKPANVFKAAKLALAHEFIMTLPKKYMTKVVLTGGKEFSIGQRQRICLARSILGNNKILILDEALSAIDVKDAVKIQNTLATVRKNLTTIVIAHKLAVARNADMIFVLKDGGVAEFGAHEELVEMKGIYYTMIQQENLIEQLEREGRSPTRDSQRASESEVEREMIAEYMRSEHYQAEATALKLKEAEPIGQIGEVPSIKKVLSVISKGSYMLYLGVFGSMLSGLVIPLLSLCLGQILNMFLGDKEDLFTTGIFWVEVLVGVAILAGIGYCTRTMCIGFIGEELAQRLRLASYKSILRQPISWFDFVSNSPSFLYARLASDVPFIKNAVSHRLGTALSALMTLVTGLVIATIYSWQLAVVASLTIPVLSTAFYVQKRALEKSHTKIANLRKDLISLTTIIIKNIFPIQAASRAFNICRHHAEPLIYPALIAGHKRATAYALAYATSEGLMFIMFGAGIRLGAELIRQNQLSIPNLFTVFFVITFGSLSVGQATSFIPEYLKARLSSSFIMGLIDLKSPVDPYNTTGCQPEITGQIEFRNVVFSYPILSDVKILQGLNLTVPAGTLLGIAGSVGSGKTTILSIIERFYEIESGQVLIDGIDVRDINLKYLRDQIGYVPQEPNLFDISIRDNILYGYQGDAVGDELRKLVEEAAMNADADFIIEELPEQFETRCGEHGKNLNAGQRQEVALARAIIKNPPILLLDDPTSALDAEEEKHVQVAMNYATAGRTTILVSNSYASLMYCDYIAVLSHGRIVEFGKQEDLLQAKGHYAKLVQQQGIKIQTEAVRRQTSKV